MARHADRLVGEEESLMTETLAGVSPSKTEDLLEEGSAQTKRAARRAHKRQLANVIIRRMWNDADHLARANSTPSAAAA